MEIKEEEEVSAFRPWADLPEPLAEVVLELLPIVDYIHFGSVCRRWQSIQREHRLRYSPSPPPMPHPLPWLVPYDPCPPHSSDPPKICVPRDGRGGTDCTSCDDDDEQVVVLESYSPLEKKNYRLPLPPGLPRSHPLCCLGSCRGWLLMTSHDSPVPLVRGPCNRSLVTTEPLLYNPITRTRIPLPPLSVTAGYVHRGALSAPPTEDPCDILFVDLKGLFLHRLGGRGGWTRALNPWEEVAFSAIACGGKFFCHYSARALVIVDPRLPEPRVEVFELGYRVHRLVEWDLSFTPSLFRGDRACLVEHDGEACFLLMRRLDHTTYAIKEFRLFTADLSSGEWVRVETLGDRVLLVDHPCALSLVATDVGLKKNTIYYAQYSRDPSHGTCWWSAFDLDTGAWVDDVGTQQVSYLEVGRRWWHNHWFLPTLDSVPGTVARP